MNYLRRCTVGDPSLLGVARWSPSGWPPSVAIAGRARPFALPVRAPLVGGRAPVLHRRAASSAGSRLPSDTGRSDRRPAPGLGWAPDALQRRRRWPARHGARRAPPVGPLAGPGSAGGRARRRGSGPPPHASGSGPGRSRSGTSTSQFLLVGSTWPSGRRSGWSWTRPALRRRRPCGDGPAAAYARSPSRARRSRRPRRPRARPRSRAPARQASRTGQSAQKPLASSSCAGVSANHRSGSWTRHGRGRRTGAGGRGVTWRAAGSPPSGGARAGGGTSGGRSSAALPLLLFVCCGRRGPADRVGAGCRGQRRRPRIPGFGFRGLGEDRWSV